MLWPWAGYAAASFEGRRHRRETHAPHKALSGHLGLRHEQQTKLGHAMQKILWFWLFYQVVNPVVKKLSLETRF